MLRLLKVSTMGGEQELRLLEVAAIGGEHEELEVELKDDLLDGLFDWPLGFLISRSQSCF